MGEMRGGASLLQQPRAFFRRGVGDLAKQLDADRALQAFVVGAIDDAHASRAEDTLDLVMPQPGTGGERHCESIRRRLPRMSRILRGSR